MKFVGVFRGEAISLEIVKQNGTYEIELPERSFTVDAVRPNPQSLSLLVESKSYEIGLEKKGDHYSVYFFSDTIELDLYEARKFKATEVTKRAVTTGPQKLSAPMPGKIVKVMIALQQTVQEGQPLLIMEAMKMQNELKAPKSGSVKRIEIREGDTVSSQQTLLVIE
jgi:biotin carboxyl carrier protein